MVEVKECDYLELDSEELYIETLAEFLILEAKRGEMLGINGIQLERRSSKSCKREDECRN